jgi:hypothetical protein
MFGARRLFSSSRVSGYHQKVFVRSPITQTKTPEQIATMQRTLDALSVVRFIRSGVKFLTGDTVPSSDSQKNVLASMGQCEFRKMRFELLDQADVFVMLHNQKTPSESGCGDAMRFITVNELLNKRRQAVVVMHEPIETTYLKQMPDASYIMLVDELPLEPNAAHQAQYPGIVYCKKTELYQLSLEFIKVLEKAAQLKEGQAHSQSYNPPKPR